MTLLLAAPDLATAQALEPLLRPAGLTVCGSCECRNLVREVVRLAPEAVAVQADTLDPETLAALQLLAQTAPRPLLLLGPDRLPDDLGPLLQAQVQAWLPGPPQPQAVADALRWASLRFAQAQRQQTELQAAATRLDERKWVDRAKGVLMQHQQLSEEQAFAVLRTASMHANLRLGEVSRGLIEAAQAAEAVNRAGQLRMLSQRLVKALALRAIDVERHRADEWLADSVQRVKAALEMLAGLGLRGPAAERLQAVQVAWPALEALVADSAVTSHLAQVDALAEQLLDAADALTAALEHASARPHLHVVNVCGRQRMLPQRLAKQALLAGQLQGAAADAQAGAAVQAMHGFEQALVWLEQAPLSTAEIRAVQARARGQWQRMLDAVRRAAAGIEPHEAARQLARESEALLASFEELTALYQHSMQGLLG
ncbi:ANTAR domain-containing protein [Aquabacterium sp. OR-4]|uniref:ANTAR domain-containing protein n=1 Tax=Aquabacterium sp. OR-4 TaxID=2978127 RepID=UPI0021B3B771|nr:ANTAR domain-containing protein [Aquabacterium sp. OR-4]MDT7836139.1 ANTAR domain-containing protein [Aquabacterium sp. OR-4]